MVILLIVDIGLAHRDVDALADLEDAIANTSVLPWQMRLPRTALGAGQRAIETGDPDYTSGRYRLFHIVPGQTTGGG
jgi:hypothetical protein